MATRFASLSPRVNEPFSDFAGRVGGTLGALGNIQLMGFDISRGNSSREGSGYAARIMYRDDGGTPYQIFYAEGTPEEASSDINAQMKDQIFPRARFVRVMDTGDQRRLHVGMLVVVAALPFESQEGRQAVMLGWGPRFQKLGFLEVGGMTLIDRNSKPYFAVQAQNRSPLESFAANENQLVWRDPARNLWFYYQPCIS